MPTWPQGGLRVGKGVNRRSVFSLMSDGGGNVSHTNAERLAAGLARKAAHLTTPVAPYATFMRAPLSEVRDPRRPYARRDEHASCSPSSSRDSSDSWSVREGGRRTAARREAFMFGSAPA